MYPLGPSSLFSRHHSRVRTEHTENTEKSQNTETIRNLLNSQSIVQSIGAIRCVYSPALDEAARSLLDARVKVFGNYETLPNLLPRLIAVESVNVVRGKEEQRDLDLDEEK